MTTTNVNLVAKMEDGKTIIGESEIPEYAEKQNTYIENYMLTQKIQNQWMEQ